MEKKRVLRGQITLFIVVGIIVLFTVALMYYVISQRSDEPSATNDDFEPLTKFISGCLEQSSITAGFNISRNGGYIGLDTTDIYHDGPVAKYYDYTQIPKNTSISMAAIEDNYAILTDESILDCIDNFSMFTGYKITYEAPETSVRIGLDRTEVTTVLRINASFKNSVKVYDEFPTVNVQLPIGRFYRASQHVILDALMDPGALNMFYLNNIYSDEGILPYYYETADEKAIVFYFYEATETNSMKMLQNNHNGLKKFVFRYGMKYQ
jgi:hypothetical protein